MKEKEKPFDPEKYFGGEVIPSKSAEEIKTLRDLATDRKTDELLGRIRKRTKTPETETAHKQTTDVKSLLRRLGGGEKVTQEDLRELEVALLGEMMDPKERVITNTERGSVAEILFTILEKQYPELGFSVNEKATAHGRRVKTHVGLEAIPYKSDKELAVRLLQHPIKRVLEMEVALSDKLLLLGLEPEKNGELPTGTTNRVLAWSYIREIKKLEELNREKSRPFYVEWIDDYLRKVADLNVKPLQNSDVRDLLEGMIAQELEKKH